MCHNDPHHGQCANSVPNIQALVLSNFKVIEVFFEVKALKPFTLICFISLSKGSNESEEKDSYYDEYSQIRDPSELKFVIFRIGIDVKNVERGFEGS